MASVEFRIQTDKDPQFLRELNEKLANALSGREPDEFGLAETFWGAVAHSLYTSIFDAFIAKKGHAADELGNTWIDHAPTTKAYKKKQGRKGISLPGPPGRPTLNKKQDKAWRGRFVYALKHLRTIFNDSEAKRRAAASAWKHVKEHHGATTLFSLMKNMEFDLNHETGALQRSFFPAPHTAPGHYLPLDANQIFRIDQGSLTVGSQVEHAARAHETRPLWPDPFPNLWLERAIKAGTEAVAIKLEEIL